MLLFAASLLLENGVGRLLIWFCVVCELSFKSSALANNAVKGMQKAWPNFCGAKMLANFIPPFTTALAISERYVDIELFFKEYIDYVIPKMETIEQSIYLYVVRHTLLENKENVLVSISSSAKSNAFGLSGRGGTMGISSTRDKVYTLQEKGFLKVVDSTPTGLRLMPVLPSEMPYIKEIEENVAAKIPLEELDFYTEANLRNSLREREGNRCFYSLQKITDENFTVDHVVSRPEGKNTYNNLVATTKAMNNRKSNMSAEDFLRSLFREDLLSESEFQERLKALQQLKVWELKPSING